MIRPFSAALGLLAATPATAQGVAEESASCAGIRGPAIQVTVTGLKDRTGRLKLELYPGNADDFLKDDTDLVREGKVFRRTWAQTPATGAVVLCVRAPAPGRYALLLTHDRDGRNKFNFWRDGAGFVATGNLGRSRPKVDQAIVTVGQGVTPVTIRVQYLRGLSGFAPYENGR
ncbi:hypothetical protein ASE86_00320 [Sphingomonas sp. Leaf33]|uniref:DUF2141 domain-containing protein n=1 Tax=Sphingomonas sp. Leaf33 TaxID=1736215 RepID=UPI0006F73B1F|nr:DUF2141 domain-containing protein [Sphingomonas sp. Leaf33]KQN24786.1 hypothetical protein ASE86_00320 [Sphingomonas sp. Leaf33]